MRRMILGGAFGALLMAASGAAATACGPDADCVIGDRTYRIAMPEGHDGATRVGAIVYAHGYRGSAAGAMRNRALRRFADELGVALIAAKSKGDDWDIPNTPSKMDSTGEAELAYFDAMLDDASRRFPIDRARLMATGFSAGGMMVWELICRRGDRFAAFAPVAGVFWAPEPKTCLTPPANVAHIHGTSDRIVPLEGRRIAQTRQGNVDVTLRMYRDYGGYGDAVESADGDLTCARRENAAGRVLIDCRHPGGHSFSIAHLRAAWTMLRGPSQL